MLKFLKRWFFPGALQLPSGRIADPSSLFGHDVALQLIANQIQLAVTFNTAASTSNTLSAANLVTNGIILRTGSPAGAVTDTTDTAANIIAAMGGGQQGGNAAIVPINGTYGEVTRILNTTGQTITVQGGAGVTVTGTATIANNAWRDFIMTPTGASALSMTNIGGGTV